MVEFEDPPEPPEPVPGSFQSPPIEKVRSPHTESNRSPRPALNPRLRFINPICNGVLILALLALVVGWWNRGALPDAKEIHRQLRKAPLQLESERASFDFEYKGELYTVEPLAEYEIAGLVVSHNNPQGWGDIYHDDASVDFQDLCIIWGSNVVDNNFHNLEYWSESWTCNFKTARQEVYEQFNPRELSNNHLLTNDLRIERIIKGARIGDQIQLKGMLVSYYPKGLKPMARKSSLTRNDIGNGACEVVFVEDASILGTGPRAGYTLYSMGWIVLILALVVKTACLLWMPLRYYRAR